MSRGASPNDQSGNIPYSAIDGGLVVQMKPADARVYLVLAAHADRQFRCRVGMRRVAEKSGLLAGSVSRSMKRLESIGAIAIERQGKGKSYGYRLCTVRPGVNTSGDEPFTARRTPREADRSPAGAEPFTPRRKTVHSPVNETIRTDDKHHDHDRSRGGKGKLHVEPADLIDPARLIALFDRVADAGLIGRSDHDRLRFVTLACYCRRTAHNPPAAFARCLRSGKFHGAQRDEDAAVALIRRAEHGDYPAHRPQPPATAQRVEPTGDPEQDRLAQARHNARWREQRCGQTEPSPLADALKGVA